MSKEKKQKDTEKIIKPVKKELSLKIFTLDYPIKYQGIANYTFLSRGTLIDADIVVIDPEQLAEEALNQNYEYDKQYQGKPILYESYSRLIIETIEKRKKELQILLDNGKTIFVFLKPLYEVNVITSVTQELKGSKTVNMRSVSAVSNYSFSPIFPQFMEGTGECVGLEAKSIYYPILKPIQPLLYYDAYFSKIPENGVIFAVTLGTKNAVGVSVPVSKGQIVFLPAIGTPISAGHLANIFISITKAFLSGGSLTPPPEWTNEYGLPGEEAQRATITKIEGAISKLNLEIEDEKEKLKKIQSWKCLLFEQGKPLETAVKNAFTLLGFSVSNFHDSSQEHDIILEADNERALGEIEGKDSKPINVDKFRQLSTNLDEDFERSGKYAKGILIGNGYRLTKPNLREPQFTDRVMEGAKAKKFAVIPTSELYQAVVYVLQNPLNEDFKMDCRDKIFNSSGDLIKFNIPRK